MIKLEDIGKICTGMAWAANVNMFGPTVNFQVEATLPFPFYDALQRELTQIALTSGITHIPDVTQPMKFIDLEFPNGIKVHIKQGDKAIVFEPITPKAKVIPIDRGNGFLKPGGERA